MPDSEDSLGQRDAERSTKLQRVPHWWIFPLIAVACAGGLIAAYLWGASSVAATGEQRDNTVPLTVTASVEQKVVSQNVTLGGQVVDGRKVPLIATASDGIERLVVTSTMDNGTVVKAGDLLATVSGQPLFLLPQSVPIYRNINAGDTGPDVVALQIALGDLGYPTARSGEFDSGTQSALSAWYESVGMKAPLSSTSEAAASDSTSSSSQRNTDEAATTQSRAGTVMFRWHDFVQVPGDSGTLSGAQPVGTVLGKEGVVGQVRVSDDVIVARADLLQADSFAQGAAVQVRTTENELESTVVSIGGFTQGDPGKGIIAGKDVTVRLPKGAKALTSGVKVTVSSSTAEAPTLAIPLVALRQEDGKTYILRKTAAGAVERVDVTVVRQAEGWAALSPTKELRKGDAVVLP